MRSFLRETYKQEGIKGIFRGAGVNFVLSPMFRGFYFGVFDTVKQIDPSPKTRWLGGYFGSLTAMLLCFPIDSVRRRLVMTACQDYHYNGFWDCVRWIYQNEGIRTFYRGCSLCVIQSCAAASILFLYDSIASDIKELHGIQA